MSKAEDKQTLFKKELLTANSDQSRTVILPVLLTAVIFSYMAYDSFSIYLIIVWAAIFIGFCLFRYFTFNSLPNRDDLTLDRKIKIVIIMMIIQGINYSASLIFFPSYSLSERVIQTLFLLGMISGSVATTCGYSKFFFSLNIPIVFSLSSFWLFTNFDGVGFGLRASIALMILLYFRVQMSLAKNAQSFLEQTIEMNFKERELNDELSKTLRQAVDASKSKTRFLASASHDLRQPIHTLQLLSAALSMQPLDKKSNKIADQMDSAIGNMASQMDGLLDISKLDAGIIEKNESVFDLIPFLERISDEFTIEAEKKNIHFKNTLNLKVALTKTDSEQLERIVRNLFSNAVKYTQQGEILLSLKDYECSWQLKIKDTGIGIAEEEKERVFEEFYQVANPERDRKQGLGLGLAIVHRLTELLSIPIAVESTLNKGTTVTIKLPYEKFDDIPISTVTQNENSQQPLVGVKVLCLDDEVAVRDALLELFEGFGCEIQLCKDIHEVRETLKHFKPDIMLADFRLVGGNTGIEAIEAARKVIPNLPALLISGDTAPERLKQADEAGIKLFHKPVKPFLLEKEIANLLTKNLKTKSE